MPRNEEELQLIQNQIQTETENYEHLRKEHEKMKQQITTIMEKIHQLCLQMKVLTLICFWFTKILFCGLQEMK